MIGVSKILLRVSGVLFLIVAIIEEVFRDR